VSPPSCGAVLDAPNGVSMIASTSHEGSEVFMRRALHFATREVGLVSLPATWLSYYIAYRAGMTVDAIAEQLDVGRKHVARRIAAVMELMRHPEIRSRMDGLVDEMGRIRFEDRGGVVFSFPGRHMSRQMTEARQ
jgi:hypothetical protein